MKDLVSSIKEAVLLMNTTDRKRFKILLFCRTTIGLLDVVGIFLLSLVISTLLASNRHSEIPSWVMFGALRNLDTSSIRGVVFLSAIALSVFVVKSITSSVLSYKVFVLLGKCEVEIGKLALVSTISRKRSKFFEETTQSVGVDLSTGIAAGFTRLLGYFVIASSEIVAFLIIGFGILIIDPFILLGVVLFLGGIGLLLHRIITDRSKIFGELLSKSTSRSIQVVQDSLALSRELGLAGLESAAGDRYLLSKQRVTRYNAQLLTLGTVPRHVIEIALLAGTGLMALALFSFRSPDDARIAISFFVVSGSRLTPSILSIQGAVSAMAQAEREGSRSMLYIKSTSLENADQQSYVLPTKSRVDISVRLSSVSVSIGGENLLSTVSTFIEPGSLVGLLGPSGSGKSTFCDLLLGMKPSSGTVQVNQMDPITFQKINPGSISFVPQSPVVFDGCLGENVSLQTMGYDEDLVRHCINQVGLVELLDDLNGPNGLLGTFGRMLSGGEAQRLCIARALYTRPRLLILDEPTSSLDSVNEIRIRDLIESLQGQLTLVVATHNPELVRKSNHLLFFDHGRVASRNL